MSDLPTDVICPGQRNLLGSGDNYLRVMFMVYWQDAPPSAEPFYLTFHQFELSYTGISTIQSEVLAILKEKITANTPLAAIYLGYEGIAMTNADLTSETWRVLT